MDGSREHQTKKKKLSSRGKAGGPGNGQGAIARQAKRRAWVDGRAHQEEQERQASRQFQGLASADPRERALAAGALLERGRFNDQEAKALVKSAKLGWPDKHRTQERHGGWASASALAMARGPAEVAEAVWASGWRFDRASAAEFLELGGLRRSTGAGSGSLALRRAVLKNLDEVDAEALWRAGPKDFFFQPGVKTPWAEGAPWPMASDPARWAGLAQRYGGADRKAQAWRFAFAGCCLGAEALPSAELAALEGLLRKTPPPAGLDPWLERMQWLWIAGASAHAPIRLASLARAGQDGLLDWRALGPLGQRLEEGDEAATGWACPAGWAQLARHEAGAEHVKAALSAQGKALALPSLDAAKGMALATAGHPEGAHGLLAATWRLRFAAYAKWEPPASEWGSSESMSLISTLLTRRGSGVEQYEAALTWAGAIGKLEAPWSAGAKSATLEKMARGERERVAWQQACLRQAAPAPAQDSAGGRKVRL